MRPSATCVGGLEVLVYAGLRGNWMGAAQIGDKAFDESDAYYKHGVAEGLIH